MVKAKIKAAKSQEEAESLKFAQKNLINKVLIEGALNRNLGCTICLSNCCYFLELENMFIVYFLQQMLTLPVYVANLYFDCLIKH